jgi:hypothetical protein
MAEKSSGRSWIRRLGANRDEQVGVEDAPGCGEHDGSGTESRGSPEWPEFDDFSPELEREMAILTLIKRAPARFLWRG